MLVGGRTPRGTPGTIGSCELNRIAPCVPPPEPGLNRFYAFCSAEAGVHGGLLA
jgi:hypothetical protein